VSYTIVVPVQSTAGFQNGLTVTAWAVSRFANGNVPAEGTSFPSGTADATATTATQGGPGQAVLVVPNNVAYNICVTDGSGVNWWTQTSEAIGGAAGSAVQSITSSDGSITIGGTSTAPTVALPAAGTAGTYGDSSHTLTITTDAKGRVTAVTANGVSITHSAITDWATALSSALTGYFNTAGSGLSSSGSTVSLPAVGTAGTSGDASHTLAVTVDGYGRVTGITVNAIAIAQSQVTGLTAALATIPTTAGGDLTGSYPNPTLAATGTAGTYTKVTTDSKGRVTSGTTLSSTDIPTIAESQVTNLTTDLSNRVQIGGDLTGTTTAPTLSETANVKAIVRDAAFTGTAEVAGTKGGAAVAAGLNVNGTTYGAVDMVIGDSISRGDGGTFGSTDWATVMATSENLLNGLAAPGPGLVLCNDATDTLSSYSYPCWSNITNGVAPSSTINAGPTVAVTSLQLQSSGKSISDNRTFRRVKVLYQTTQNGDGVTFAVTGGSAPSATLDTNSGATGATLSGSTITIPTASLVGVAPQLGDAVSYVSGTGTAWAWSGLTPYISGISVSGSNTLITTSLASSAGTGTAVLAFSGYRMWDSGDLGSVVGTGISATYANHVTGSGGGYATVIGARYYQTAGTNGVTIDNLGIGGTTTPTWGAGGGYFTPGYQPWGWMNWLMMHVAAGTPIRRMFIIMGINDPGYGYTAANYATYLGNIVSEAQLLSPTTEIVVVAEYYGDVTYSFTSAVTTSGSTIVSCPTFNQVGIVTTPIVGSNINGLGITQGTTVSNVYGAGATVSSSCSTSGTAMTGTGFTNANGYYTGMTVTGPGISGVVTITVNSATSITLSASAGTNTSQTYTFSPAVVMSAAATASSTYPVCTSGARGGPAKWNNWIASAQGVANLYGATFINLNERFGDLSAKGQSSNVTTTTGSQTISCSAGFPGAVAGQSINGPGIAPGTIVQSYSAPNGTTLTLSQPAIATSSTATLYWGGDKYGLAQKFIPNIHMGDASESWSGRDGQKSMAGWIWSRLQSNVSPYTLGNATSPWRPSQQNLIAANMDPATAVSTLSITAGTVYYFAIWVPQATTITNILYNISTGGGTTANCYVGLYSAAGTQLGVSANLGAAWGTTGAYTTPLSSPLAVSAGLYFVGLVAGTATSLALRGIATNSVLNTGATFTSGTLAGGGRAMTTTTGQTTLPASVSTLPAAFSQAPFMALS